MTTSTAPAGYLAGPVSTHINRMTASAGLGLLALFTVDFADLFFISLLGERELAAAVGFAASILFFCQSLSIGLTIAVGATVSRALGADRVDRARELIASSFVLIILITSVVAGSVWLWRESILTLLGAEGYTLSQASNYIAIILPSFVPVSIGMAAGGVIRAKGDAKGALWVTLSGAIVNAIFDPILIFAMNLDLTGAALASVMARLTIFGYGVFKLYKYGLLSRPKPAEVRRDFTTISSIAVPSVLTNLATPIGLAFVTATMAQYGDSAVAGLAIITRLQQVAFVALFALSGAVGPIAGQNWGAGYHDRVSAVLTESVRFVFRYCLVVCVALAALTEPIVWAFQASPQAAELIRWFTLGLSAIFVFNGITFVTNALFNNLGAPKTSTLFNVLKATVFTVPFVWAGARWFGAPGALIGQGLGSAMIALAGWYWCRRYVGGLRGQSV
ncbi:MATE family efflux transporter [Saccharospirillum impatiens]|jgi:putative MATE family efflux protein|uniref:MATE family efflux transporter n=1 Tax=Saccharospirillum impatiens TaxID=169438 RepID=UPI0004294CDD|nr:MATE family efflux transporter [Saccharospirillum impatiens]